MVPCPKQGLIHQRRVMLLMKQAPYPQATTAVYVYLFWLCRVRQGRLMPNVWLVLGGRGVWRCFCLGPFWRKIADIKKNYLYLNFLL